MISHELQCIMVHIPRTGGTSVEHALVGDNWWRISKETKHLTWKQAKEIYSDYWDDYFKFSIVRDPWERSVSMLRYSQFFYGKESTTITNNMLRWYGSKFNHPDTTEYDYRFYSIDDVVGGSLERQSVYVNIFGYEMDFIAKTESLQTDFEFICSNLGIEPPHLGHRDKSNRKSDTAEYFSKSTIDHVGRIYKKDIELFGYKPPMLS